MSVGVGVGVFAVFNRLACGPKPRRVGERAEEKPAEGWLRHGTDPVLFEEKSAVG